jgi:predicted amidohydrolase YtcJ
LSIRCLPLLLVDPFRPQADRLAFVEGLGARSGFGDDWLRLWGLKFVLDGGVAGAAMEQPSANDPTYTRHLNWDPDEMTEVVSHALARNWKVGTHAVGDRTVRTVLDVYERARSRSESRSPFSTHSSTSTDKRSSKAAGRSEQRPSCLSGRGSKRAPRSPPAPTPFDRSTVRPFDPMLNIWGMVTRGTKDIGVQGPEQAIDQYTAIELYTSAGTRLTGEADRRGTLEPRQLADFAAYRADPVTVPVDDLPSLAPPITCVGGRAVHDPDRLLEPQTSV